jgi:hypothetical protein
MTGAKSAEYGFQANSPSSYFNVDEASTVLRLALLMGTDETVKSIVLVCTYKAQVKLSPLSAACSGFRA